MRILYDGHVYQMQPVGGIARYLVNIVSRLPDDWKPIVTVGINRLPEYRQLRFPVHRNLLLKRFPFPGLRPKQFLNWASKQYFSKVESAGDFNLIHSVHHGSIASPGHSRRRAAFVLTVHDMIPEMFNFDCTGSDVLAKKRAVESADAVLCNSHNTRKDLLERIKISEDRVFVTHLASELSRASSFGEEPTHDRPYFLFVGARQAAYKNFRRLLEAFSRVAEKYPEVCLCAVGPVFQPHEQKLMAELKIAGRVRNINFVTDAHLAKLYRCSLALTCPSLYEGFGIPPLEAMACGSVAVVSNTSSLPEVTGEPAIKVSPESVESIADGMFQVLNLSAAQRRELITKSMVWASRFNWDKTARETMAIYETLLR